MYGTELSEIYELIFRSRGKNWVAEAKGVAELIRAHSPAADSLLDVACGTGAHLRTLRKFFSYVEGLEISPPMRQKALEALPGVAVHEGDMREFSLGRRFEAVTCLFNAIGYVSTPEEMRRAVRAMADHLEPGGVLVVEPWWFPEKFIEGYVAGDVVREEGRVIARVSHSTRQGRATRMEAHFTVADRDGIRSFVEIDLLALFTLEEYLEAFAAAGCPATYLPGGLTGCGLFVGTRDSGPS
ncbi:dTDP-3-amino-3,4,6-trideoxy-alpha-D-glucopyranose N,N-dimethyltransferase/N-dimethyltransferase [Nonomuraea polychroma]|uniref:dTDP-3-amino-3,4, 6-trideoxy-alpha-D-glucopyranose N,N-dimethyltransferase/N-dimethyltransferase n=1 Tax=Nonomuraea polychroma TaxID=46176 RepID=A0A438LYZ6_9ACTN|nr:class I SAM-dependent methyltransferase [Nonomuraea polychroma]RVX38759.1 dTDP-3-amino-3,4,6-trideoxy-alpha-D-glucopyranose N,N-dimethyltransferase/N-dimethyltransferase [Nonomuraea polychroma]